MNKNSRLSLLLWQPEESSAMCRWRQRVSVTEVGVAGWAWSTHYGVSQTVANGRGARVYNCTCVHDNIPCRRLPK